jgi:hypothetical protein
MSEKKVIGYRACRVQRFWPNRYLFTLPLDTKRFDTAKQAFEHVGKLNAMGFKDNWFWIQEIFSDGTFSEEPKPPEDFGLEQLEEPTPSREQPTVEIAEPSEREKTWGFRVDSSLIRKRDEDR